MGETRCSPALMAHCMSKWKISVQNPVRWVLLSPCYSWGDWIIAVKWFTWGYVRRTGQNGDQTQAVCQAGLCKVPALERIVRLRLPPGRNCWAEIRAVPCSLSFTLHSRGERRKAGAELVPGTACGSGGPGEEGVTLFGIFISQFPGARGIWPRSVPWRDQGGIVVTWPEIDLALPGELCDLGEPFQGLVFRGCSSGSQCRTRARWVGHSQEGPVVGLWAATGSSWRLPAYTQVNLTWAFAQMFDAPLSTTQAGPLPPVLFSFPSSVLHSYKI